MEKDKFLANRIKETELAIKEAELNRIKAEAARTHAEKAKLDFELKQLSLPWWKPRQPLRALMAVIVIIPLFWLYYNEQQAKDFAEMMTFQQAKLDSVHFENARIAAAIDSAQVRGETFSTIANNQIK